MQDSAGPVTGDCDLAAKKSAPAANSRVDQVFPESRWIGGEVMRSGLATALVVCGTLLTLVPSISDYLHGYQVSQFLSDRTIQKSVTRIHQPFGETFRASAWVLGVAMIGLGAIGGGILRTNRGMVDRDLDSRFGSDMLVGSESYRGDASRTGRSC